MFSVTLQTSPYIHSFISIQPWRPGWQKSEPSHVTGMALAHCILGKSLEVVCHCFTPPLDFPTFAARCLYVRNDARDPSSERWNCGREIVRQFCLNSDFHVNLGIFYMPKIYDMGRTALLPLRRKACWGLFPPFLVKFIPLWLGRYFLVCENRVYRETVRMTVG